MNKKEAILSAALKLLVENGIHATPMSAIAKEAEVGMGTIYNYFPNKEILINSLYVNIKEEEKILFDIFNNSKSIQKQFEKYYKDVIQFFISKPLYFHFIEQVQASPIITEESRERGYMAITSVIELVELGIEQKVIKNINLDELMQFIGGTLVSFLRQALKTNKYKGAPLKNQLKLVWDAIKE